MREMPRLLVLPLSIRSLEVVEGELLHFFCIGGKVENGATSILWTELSRVRKYRHTANWYLSKKVKYLRRQLHLPNFQISNSNISNLDLADANSASIACTYLIPSNFQKPRERCKQLKTFRSKSGHFKTNLNIITMQAFQYW